MEFEIKYMQRCLDLAKLGERRVAPNPMVGSVVVHNGQIIGEGFHRRWGEPHAEVNAIASVKRPELLSQSTLYVNLEPCSHHGKTPPCADLIVAHKIPRVVVGTIDPFSKVAGRGIEHLRRNGCEVVVGVLETACHELNRRFFTFHQKKRPYIILKWAETADGFVDIDRSTVQLGQPTWITNEMARITVHKQRATEQAILIGTETAIKDNPSLTVRDWYGEQPLRIVTDRFNRIDAHSNLFDGNAPTLCISTQTTSNKPQVESLLLDISTDLIDATLEHLHQKGIQSVVVEGGPTMLQSFIDRNLWDEAHVYIGQLAFGDGVKAPRFEASPKCFDRFYNSELRVFRNI
jgi:diaminohydroxyphosphoribosylaminopyrimidine deaminase / 5-amino-6-(5-phosphoribosylamino)uracil reductase